MNEGTYTLLESLPGTPDTINTGAQNYSYFRTAYNMALTVTVALALIMIVVGGIQYTISWASPSAKGEAKDRILGAIGGLILALVSYILLKEINPALIADPNFIK
ncbi:MAG TPA: hypothetical protein VJB98_02790 [Candidatus Paceibacterota bacterium]